MAAAGGEGARGEPEAGPAGGEGADTSGRAALLPAGEGRAGRGGERRERQPPAGLGRGRGSRASSLRAARAEPTMLPGEPAAGRAGRRPRAPAGPGARRISAGGLGGAQCGGRSPSGPGSKVCHRRGAAAPAARLPAARGEGGQGVDGAEKGSGPAEPGAFSWRLLTCPLPAAAGKGATGRERAGGQGAGATQGKGAAAGRGLGARGHPALEGAGGERLTLGTSQPRASQAVPSSRFSHLPSQRPALRSRCPPQTSHLPEDASPLPPPGPPAPLG